MNYIIFTPEYILINLNGFIATKIDPVYVFYNL